MFEKTPKYISSNAVEENATYFQKLVLLFSLKKMKRISNTAMLLYASCIGNYLCRNMV